MTDHLIGKSDMYIFSLQDTSLALSLAAECVDVCFLFTSSEVRSSVTQSITMSKIADLLPATALARGVSLTSYSDIFIVPTCSRNSMQTNQVVISWYTKLKVRSITDSATSHRYLVILPLTDHIDFTPQFLV